MTVTYTSEVANCKGFCGCFLKLLARWRGSIYKLVWTDLILYLFIYYVLNISYHNFMDDKSKVYFADVVKYFGKYASLVPLSFVLGFYVDIVMERWWNQYCSIPFPDNLATLIGASVKGQGVKFRALKRTMVRHLCVSFTMTLTMISPKIKKRFPSLDHFIKAGLLTKGEKNIIDELDSEFPMYTKYWLPLAWVTSAVVTAKEEGFIRDGEYADKILEQLNEFRNKCGSLLSYDWISVPLVYTQVVTIAVYSYFLFSVIGNQYLGEENKYIIASYFPVIPVLEFLFYMGWLKVAETLTNPFGDDDDDFELMWMVDRHLQVSYLLVDQIPQKLPRLLKDIHWKEMAPFSLPFTKATESYMREHPLPSTNKITLSNAEREIVMPQLPKFQSDVSGQKGLLLTSRRSNMLKTPTNLKSVVSGDSMDLDDMEEALQETNAGSEKETLYCEEFESLRKKRIDEHRKRLELMFNSIKVP